MQKISPPLARVVSMAVDEAQAYRAARAFPATLTDDAMAALLFQYAALLTGDLDVAKAAEAAFREQLP